MKVGEEGEKANRNGNEEAFEKESDKVGKEDEEVDGNRMDEAFEKEIIADDGSKREVNDDTDPKTGNEVQFTQLNKNIENKVQGSDNASFGDVTMEEASRVDVEAVSQTKKEDELLGNE